MSRLSWFPLYVDDFLGGVSRMTDAEIGRYMLCLLAQWSSGEQAAIPGAELSLKAMCRGNDPGPNVLEKFEAVDGLPAPKLRNRRLYDEWIKARKEHDGKVLGGKLTAKLAAELPSKATPQPTTHNTQQTTDNKQHTTHKRPSAPAARSPDGSEPGWQTQAADDWIAEYGGNPPKQFFGAVKPVVRKHGWERVRPVLKFFLGETEIEFLNMGKFSGAFGQWEARMGGLGKPKVSTQVREREAGFAAFMRGGNGDSRLLGQGESAPAGEPSPARREPRSAVAAGADLPGGAGPSGK